MVKDGNDQQGLRERTKLKKLGLTFQDVIVVKGSLSSQSKQWLRRKLINKILIRFHATW